MAATSVYDDFLDRYLSLSLSLTSESGQGRKRDESRPACFRRAVTTANAP